jgi:hypothetical protein
VALRGRFPEGIGEEQTGHLAGSLRVRASKTPQRRRWHPLTATEFLLHVHHVVAASAVRRCRSVMPSTPPPGTSRQALTPWDAGLTETLPKIGLQVEEEHLIDDLVEDLAVLAE